MYIVSTAMKRRGSEGSGSGDSSQLRIEWGDPSPPSGNATSAVAEPPADEAEQSLVQRLRWDFRESFPEPLPEAIDTGILSDEDIEPENIRAIHDEQGRQLLATLRDMSFIGDARRRLFDPRTGKAPSDPQDKERLQRRLTSETQRLELWWQTLIDTYAEAFGEEAADAFGKAIRARNAGIDVVAESQPGVWAVAPKIHSSQPIAAPVIEPAVPVKEAPKTPEVRRPPHPRTVSAHLPVPRPLNTAIAAGHFGRDESGVVIRPTAREVRAITLRHSEKLIDLLEAMHQASLSCIPPEVVRLEKVFRNGIATYAEDFGEPAARQLEAFVRRQASLRIGPGDHRGRHR
jgi:hypothetical protein